MYRRFLLAAAAAKVAGECTREALREATDKYVASQASGELDPLFSSAAYRENNRESSFETGLISEALDVAHQHVILDTVECASYAELIVTAGDGYVIGTQLRFAEDDKGELAAELVDSIVSTEGDWLFDAAQTLEYVEGENWSEISEGERDSREALLQAADAYLDLWGNSDAEVPWGDPCNRLEGSAYTDGSCSVGIPSGDYPPNSDRRYVVDEVMGCVSVLCVFETMDDAPDAHEFRLEGGKLRYVHTITVLRDLD